MNKVIVSRIETINLVIYNESNLVHIDVMFFSFATSLNILTLRHKRIPLFSLLIISVYYDYVKVAEITTSPSKASKHFCWVKISYIFTFDTPKSLLLKNYRYPFWKPWCSLKEFYPLPHSGHHCCVFIPLSLIRQERICGADNSGNQ